MTDNRNPKRYKNLFSWFKNDFSPSIPVDQHEEIESEDDQHKRASNQEGQREQQEDVQDYNITSLERDPGKRHAIAYVVHGPYQPYLDDYPCTQHGNQGRKFSHRWFKEWPWLEYSLDKDKVYCFPCFLFDEYPSRHPYFTDIGFNSWKNHIERVINRLSEQELANNRLRLVATIEAVRLLARQGCSFRGHDESVDSPNGGNFDAVLNSFKRINDEINKVVDSALGNAKYTCSTIQKQVANILTNKVRAMIRDEVGDSKFAILVDEALDVSYKEQMAIILRFVNREGLIRGRFFKVLRQYDLHVENMRGQGYDGANNMHSQFNGLQALFLKECPYAYCVHCFAHRMQLCLNAAAKGLPVHLRRVREKIKLALCKEQELRTQCGSHFRSISSLIKLFGATQTTIDELYVNGVDKVQGEAKAIGKAMKKFDFVYCLHMMHDIMRTTDFLCQALQKKDLDILNALHFLSITKEKLQDMRENAFCCRHDISMPDISAPYKKGSRNCEKNITNEHYYRFNILYMVIDFQLTELETRFTDSSVEILLLSASFDPRHSFRAFKGEDVCKLALKYYPLDFSSHDESALKLECEFFVQDVQKDPRFANTPSISELCRRMVDFDKTMLYPMIYRLICLILTLPVSTATTERAFSSMKIIKRRLRNKMNDEFLDDLMVLYIQRRYADNIENDKVIAEFELSGSRRVKFS
ncbi:hypothetical protein RND81_02G064200 [Saponaria officinalis]|uniref:TTF-type domain-containing protein n=1 Tax=Saponaria officinalis TaxID=3572 RepID=A0AAW1MR33_SAPOF